MDLWVRSQDRKRLTKIEDVYMVEDDYEKDNILSFPKYYIGNTLVGHLGTYKSKERALEVLDEIQRKISQNECLKIMIPKLNNVKGEEENIGELFKGMVYEMPKE